MEHVKPIGKEVIVDPSDTDEGLTAEMLRATDVVEYENLSERIEALRVAIRAVGIEAVARASKVSRSEIQAIVNGRTVPRKSTIAKLEEALARLHQPKPVFKTTPLG